jgi:hypothetical protein
MKAWLILINGEMAGMMAGDSHEEVLEAATEMLSSEGEITLIDPEEVMERIEKSGISDPQQVVDMMEATDGVPEGITTH